ncbi:MAG: RNase adapter RapZ [Byssovorax sp.]
MSEPIQVVVVTGLSGAGKSTALHALEDLGYYCVDNLPPALLQKTVEVCETGGVRRIALGIDVRVGSFLDGAEAALVHLGSAPIEGAQVYELVVLFLDATDEVLLRRFSETRRPHPLTSAARERLRSGSPLDWPEDAHGGVGAVAVLDGIQLERERLARLRARATVTLDTTLLSVHDLRRQVIAHLGPGRAEHPRMVTRFISFGFKYGAPVDADLIFDVRMLDNPHFVPELRPLTGMDKKVRDYVLKSPEAQELVRRIEAVLAFSLPLYEREGKSYLTVAVGCTGGRHRSVAIATALAEALRPETGLPILVLHRDARRADILGGSTPAPGMDPRGGEKGVTQ